MNIFFISKEKKHVIRAWGMLFMSHMLPLSLIKLPGFFADFIRFRKLSQESFGRSLPQPRLGDSYPCLHDRTKGTPFDGHYFYQGAWISRRLKDSQFSGQHVDVGSSIMSISVLSAFVNTLFVDYRPLDVNLTNLKCIAGDIIKLPFQENSIESISCLHVIEHIGLGRYGDPLDPSGHQKAAAELQRVVKSGGTLYITTPVGNEKICFNGHRIFNPNKFALMFSNMNLISFSYVDDELQYHQNMDLNDASKLNYGCGFFEFRKKQ
jgi:hypothetical protein